MWKLYNPDRNPNYQTPNYYSLLRDFVTWDYVVGPNNKFFSLSLLMNTSKVVWIFFSDKTANWCAGIIEYLAILEKEGQTNKHISYLLESMD